MAGRRQHGAVQRHLADYRTEIVDSGEMMVNTTGELINLAEAHRKAMQMYGQVYAARYGVV